MIWIEAATGTASSMPHTLNMVAPAISAKMVTTGCSPKIHGDGQQVRGNTYVGDCVRATMAAVQAPPGEVYNVGGGEAASVWDILHRLEALAGRAANVRQEPARPGEPMSASLREVTDVAAAGVAVTSFDWPLGPAELTAVNW